MPKPNGVVFYRGPSMIDGKPIVAIMTGLAHNSSNEKTGALLQTWILRADVNPLRAVDTGADVSICGDCKHRGRIVRVGRKLKNKGRSCYVRLDTAPNNIYKTMKRRRYPTVTPNDLVTMLARRIVRGGSYGDPAAVPFHVWAPFMDLIKTAYTHQWSRYPELAAFCMASVDTSAEKAMAKMLGYRTFRVRGENEQIEQGEIACPASAEMQHRTQCFDCKLCGGARVKAKDIVIIAHGARKGSFANAQA